MLYAVFLDKPFGIGITSTYILQGCRDWQENWDSFVGDISICAFDANKQRLLDAEMEQRLSRAPARAENEGVILGAEHTEHGNNSTRSECVSRRRRGKCTMWCLKHLCTPSNRVITTQGTSITTSIPSSSSAPAPPQSIIIQQHYSAVNKEEIWSSDLEDFKALKEDPCYTSSKKYLDQCLKYLQQGRPAIDHHQQHSYLKHRRWYSIGEIWNGINSRSIGWANDIYTTAATLITATLFILVRDVIWWLFSCQGIILQYM